MIDPYTQSANIYNWILLVYYLMHQVTGMGSWASENRPSVHTGSMYGACVYIYIIININMYIYIYTCICHPYTIFRRCRRMSFAPSWLIWSSRRSTDWSATFSEWSARMIFILAARSSSGARRMSSTTKSVGRPSGFPKKTQLVFEHICGNSENNTNHLIHGWPIMPVNYWWLMIRGWAMSIGG